MHFHELSTPAALVDLDRVEANTSHMSERVQTLGARLRPHVKTHKCVEAARFQVRGHFGGITVSTLAEARLFGRSGFRDITYAVPIAPNRLEEAVEVASSIDELNLILDHEATFAAMSQCARAKNVRLNAYLKVDCGYHRAGVDPTSEDSVKLALRMSESPSLRFRGILTHAGHAYDCKGPTEIKRVAEDERGVMVRFAETLRRAGAAPPEVSIGSTPTMSLGESLEGVSEARPGNYVFYDRFQAAVGSCTLENTAFSVLVTVIGQYPAQNKLLIDAGALAFSKDEGPTHIDPECGYGAIFSADGSESFDELRLEGLSQEHGKIRGLSAIHFDQFPVGRKLRIVPNHSCLSSALFDRYHVMRRSEIVEEWRPVRGW